MAEASARSSEIQSGLEQLAVLARKRLPSMLDEESGLFVEKTAWTPSKEMRSTTMNVLYSAMSTVGIQQDGDGLDDTVPVDRTLDALYQRAHRGATPAGLLGATIWGLALSHDDRTNSLVRSCGLRLKASRAASMELGLMLSGLASAMQVFPSGTKTDTI